MNLRDIQAFVMVAETGSVNKAAARLHLTQPAVTRRLQSFEAAMSGAVLLDRSIKPPVLTPAGTQVLEKCRQILMAVAELQAFSANNEGPAGDLRIGLAHGLHEFVMTEPLDNIRLKFPKVRLKVRTDWTERLIEGIRTGALDCAVGLIADHSIPASIHVRPIRKETIDVIAARDGTWNGHCAPLALRNLANEAWVISPPGCGCRAVLQRALDNAKLPMQIAAEILGEELQLSIIARGGGLGFVPRRFVENSHYRGQLRILPVLELGREVNVTLLHRPSLGNLAEALDRLHVEIGRQLDGRRGEETDLLRSAADEFGMTHGLSVSLKGRA